MARLRLSLLLFHSPSISSIIFIGTDHLCPQIFDIPTSTYLLHSIMTLTSTNPDVKFLKKLVRDGSITSMDQARTVYDAHDRVNEKYKLKNFRLCLSNILNDKIKVTDAVTQNSTSFITVSNFYPIYIHHLTLFFFSF